MTLQDNINHTDLDGSESGGFDNAISGNAISDQLDFSQFIEGCSDLGISLSDRQVRQFDIYYHMMAEKNKVMNLTAITEFEEVVSKHYLDSLLVVRHADMSKVSNILDMGTGAGFPGIPLKIVFPQIHMTLADSLNKRILFLNEVIEKCHLDGIDTVHARAEEMGRNKAYREKYDLVVSRAVANLSTLTEYCLPFVRKGGMFISYKAADVEDEFRAAEKAIAGLGGKCKNPVYDRVPHTDLERSFIIISKVKNTPARYPRKAGLPSKEPIS